MVFVGWLSSHVLMGGTGWKEVRHGHLSEKADKGQMLEDLVGHRFRQMPTFWGF